MIIAAARPDQVDEIVALWEKCHLTEEGDDPLLDAQQIMDSPMSILMVAEADDDPRVVSTAVAGFDGHRGNIYFLATSPEQPRVAQELMQTACDWLADRGAAAVTVLASEASLGFFEERGFKRSPSIAVSRSLIDG